MATDRSTELVTKCWLNGQPEAERAAATMIHNFVQLLDTEIEKAVLKDRQEPRAIVATETRTTQQSIDIARQCWNDPRTNHKFIDDTLAKVFAETLDRRTTLLRDDLERAWGVIANAYGGIWCNAPFNWQVSAERWRDECLPHINK